MTRLALWRTTTPGEDWFQCLYAHLGHPLSLHHSRLSDLDYLVDSEAFVDAVRLSATMDVALRCIRDVREAFEDFEHPSPERIGRYLRAYSDLPLSLTGDRRFLELTLKAAEIARSEPRARIIKSLVIGDGPLACYLCGEALAVNGHLGKPSDVDHLWPQSLGGDTVEANLIAACKDCNSKRMHQITWATGPVHSTWLKNSGTQANLPPLRKNRRDVPAEDLTISLALARLMKVACGQSGQNGGVATTLKEAAILLGPLKRPLVFPPSSEGRRFTFLELMLLKGNTV